MKLVLASRSIARRAMLSAAGVPHESVAATVDEQAAKASLGHLAPCALADTLAERKARDVSARYPADMVLGCDTIAVLEGAMLDKPRSRDEATEHLSRMSGKRHDLISAALIVECGRVVWRQADVAAMYVRPLSYTFIQWYVGTEWPAIAGCVGCYRIEGPGAQLFDRIEGSHFTVLGMPLLPLLGYLRTRAILPS